MQFFRGKWGDIFRFFSCIYLIFSINTLLIFIYSPQGRIVYQIVTV